MVADQGLTWDNAEGTLPAGTRVRVQFTGSATGDGAVHIDGTNTVAGMVGQKWLRQVRATVEVLPAEGGDHRA